MSHSFLALFAVLTFALAPAARAARFSLPDESGLTHCRITYDQCLNRGAGAPAWR